MLWRCAVIAMLALVGAQRWTESAWQEVDQENRSRSAQAIATARHESSRGNAIAAADALTKALELSPDSPDLLRWRGREYFCAGEIAKSVADFDQVAKLAPAEEKSLWERGISLYYLGEFARGAKQFELYQTYHDADVENAAWRYLCVARSQGLEAARKSILPIQGDRRVPMMAIYALYQGEGSRDEVFAACDVGEPPAIERKQRLFYAHLYVGLHYEAAGETAKAREHITKASVEYPIPHYMGDVARIHAKYFSKSIEPAAAE